MSERTPRPEPTAYLILGTARSGSTLLCQALAGTGLAGDPKEYFGAKMASWMRKWETPDPVAYAARLARERATPNGVFGAKLLWQHLRHLGRASRQHPALADLDDGELLATLFPGVRWVWITRDDKVRQAVSYWKARESGVWGQRGSRRTIPLKEPEFDEAGIARLLETVLREEDAIGRFFAANGIVPCRIVYETLAADYEPTTRGLLACLGIPVPPDLAIADPRTRKLADSASDAWAERFRLARGLGEGTARPG